jgi:uncharacterized membrane protein YuzA (DUF378 family)
MAGQRRPPESVARRQAQSNSDNTYKEKKVVTSTIRRISGALAVIGALNWGLVGLARFDLVAEIFGMKFGETNAATRIIYGLVGIAGVVLAVTLVRPDHPERATAPLSHSDAGTYSRR